MSFHRLRRGAHHHPWLERLCADEVRWGLYAAVAALSSAAWEALIRTVLEPFHRKLAIAVRCLHEITQQQMRRRAEQHLHEFWGLDPGINALHTANRFVRLGQSAGFYAGGGQPAIITGGTP